MKKLIKKAFNAFGYDIHKYHKPISKYHKQFNLFEAEAGLFKVAFEKLEMDGSLYFVPKYAEHRPAVQKVLNGEYYEPLTHEFVSKLCSLNKGSIVHAGTFFGDMIPNFSKAVSGTVYAFEPVLENYILAKLCVDNNCLDNVFLLNAALGSTVTNLRIDTNEDDGRHAGGGSKVANDGSICSSVTLDSLHLDDLILIQLDVEGHELEALRGAKDSIQRCRPLIAIEDNNKSCSDFLTANSYVFHTQIPGLGIWVPDEKNDFREQLKQFFN
ncbi:MAG: FkbM family methyltransferase [Gammaproteobacteria bacterium]|nr:FkbM family methyltransferase [Gammaproteobacteria bacterium]